MVFDWALIVLSALIGAALIMESIRWPLPYAVAVTIVLSAVGIAVQGRWLLLSRKEMS